MSLYPFIMTLALLVVKPSFGDVKPLKLKEAIKSESIQKSILTEPQVSSEVSEIIFRGEKGQKMDFWAAGLHPRDCRLALRKLSRYEDYKQYLSYLEESLYFEDIQLVSFYIKTPIFPIRVSLRFKIPRITKEGVYPFIYEQGFLKDLKGTIHVSQEKDRCFFYIKADWEGRHSGFSNTLLEFFSKTLVKLGMEKLFRISSL